MIDDIFAAKMPSMEKEILQQLMASARLGHLCLDIGKVDFSICKGICQEGNLLYLERNWIYETRVITELKRLCAPLASAAYESAELTDEQNKAVNTALSHAVSIVAGGPGTGKTFVVKHLIEALGKEAKVVLAGPTGKAVMRLKELNPLAAAGTLHALLEIRPDQDFFREEAYLFADAIIVDECSMIDAKLLGFFLRSVPKGCRIVLLGDPNQLPPVEAGSLFADLIGLVPTAHLTRCMRSDRAEVLNLATAILEGKEIIPHAPSCDVEKQADQGSVILSCVRKGPWGVDTINKKLAEKAGSKIPILITKSDALLGLYNGDTAVLDRAQGFALFSSGKTLPEALLPPYEPAFCLSVHKSQGSEFDHVVVLVPPGSEVFGKEVLYTAVTRAKFSVKLIGDPEIIRKTLQNSSKRTSGLRMRWSAF